MSPADARYRHSVLWELRHTWLRLEIAPAIRPPMAAMSAAIAFSRSEGWR